MTKFNNNLCPHTKTIEEEKKAVVIIITTYPSNIRLQQLPQNLNSNNISLHKLREVLIKSMNGFRSYR